MALSLEEIKARRRAALGKVDGAAKAAPFSAKAPAAEAPADDDAVTMERPLPGASPAPKPASSPSAPKAAAAKKPRSPDDTRTTVEFDLSEKAKETSDVPPPPSVAPVAAPPVAVPRPSSAPEPASKGRLAGPEEEGPQEAPPKPADVVAQVMESLKPLLTALEERLGIKIVAAETAAGKATAQVNAVVDEILGQDKFDGDVVDTDGDGKVTERRPSVRKAIGALEGKLGTLSGDVKSAGTAAKNAEQAAGKATAQVNAVVDEILGTDKYDGDVVDIDGAGQVTERRPSVRKALGQLDARVAEAAGDALEAKQMGGEGLAVLRGMLGQNYGKLHALVVSHEIMTRKLLVNHLREDDYLKRVRKVAVEQEPEAVRIILEAFATPDPDTEAAPVYGVMKLSLAQAQNSSIERLEKDPKLAKWVEDITPQMVERARDCLNKVDWAKCEAENWEMIFGKQKPDTAQGGDE